jgi:hypothetical protein
VNMYVMPLFGILFSAGFPLSYWYLKSYICFPFIYRILDNLPLVVPIKRNDQDSTVYQLGFHVGLKGQYTGVRILFLSTMVIVVNTK